MLFSKVFTCSTESFKKKKKKIFTSHAQFLECADNKTYNRQDQLNTFRVQDLFHTNLVNTPVLQVKQIASCYIDRKDDRSCFRLVRFIL